jgi:AcrR family transcriptional regulator
MNADLPAPRGRPPSRHTEEAILAATARLLASHRYSELTFDRIAAEARCGKAAIFRRWSSKASLAAAALRLMFETANPGLPPPGPPGVRVRAFLHNTAEMLGQTPAGLVIRNVISELGHEPELAALVGELEAERRRLILELLAPFAEQPGERAILMSLLFGPLYLRWLVTREPLDAGFVDACVDRVLEDRHAA